MSLSISRITRPALLGTCLTALSLVAASTVFAQEAYFSVTGESTHSSNKQLFYFDTYSSISSSETLEFITYHHTGGTNKAGDLISGGGFDPYLNLRDDGGNEEGGNDDGYTPISGNYDAYLTWPGDAPYSATLGFITTDPLPVDAYKLEQTAVTGSSQWAVDLVGPAPKLALTDLDATSGSAVYTLKFGTTGGGGAPALVDLPQSATLTVGSELYVGHTGKGSLTGLGTLNSGLAILGTNLNSEGAVTLTASGNWSGSNDVRVGHSGDGTLLIQAGAIAVFQGDMYLAYLSTSEGEVTVTGNDSILTVNGDMEVGDGGTGTLLIENGGWVNSSGIGTNSRDVIGNDSLANGTVTVTGTSIKRDSTWNTDDLIIGDNGQGTLNIEDQGDVTSSDVRLGENNNGTAIVTGFGSSWTTGTMAIGSGPNGPGIVNLLDQATISSGNVTVGSNAGDGFITVNGMTDGLGLRATWDVTGTVDIGSAGLGDGTINVEQAGQITVTDSIDVTGSVDASGTLTVQTNGEVTANNNLNIGQNGTVNLYDAGSRIEAGTFTKSSNGAFNWTGGTLEITGQTVNIDTVSGHSVLGNSLTVGTGKTLAVSFSDISDQSLLVGNQGTGTLRLENGGRVLSGRGTLGGSGSASGTVTVDAPGSWWEATYIRVGQSGSADGTINILNGGKVSASQDVYISGFSATASGTVLVDGSMNSTDSTFDVEGTLAVGGQPSMAGGTGILTVINGGRVEVGQTLRVWDSGTVTINSPSVVVADRVQVSSGATFNANVGSALYVNQLIGFGDTPVIGGNLLFGQADGTTAASYSVGTSQSLSVGSNLVIGVDKPATLAVSSGGYVQSFGGFIGGMPGSGTSSVAVSDTGSTWVVQDSLNVGGDGTSVGGASTLLIENDATVNVAGLVTVWPGSTVTLNGASLIAADVELANGTLRGNGQVGLTSVGTLINEGNVSPGFSTGVIDVTGSYSQSGNGELIIELVGGGGVAGVDFDQLSVTYSASLAGQLTLPVIAPYIPDFGDAFEVLSTGAGVTGRFDLIVLPDLSGIGLRMDYSDPDSVYIRAWLRGDLNLDGFVGITDLNIVLSNWNLETDAGVWSQGDPSGDGFVGITDLNEVLGNWNTGIPQSADVNIPEPTVTLMLLAGALGLAGRRH